MPQGPTRTHIYNGTIYRLSFLIGRVQKVFNMVYALLSSTGYNATIPIIMYFINLLNFIDEFIQFYVKTNATISISMCR